MRRWWKNLKLASVIALAIPIALIWFLGPFVGLTSPAARLTWMLGLMALWAATLLLRRILSDRAGSLIEHVLQRQADDAVMGAPVDRRAEVNQLRHQLLGAIETLKGSKIGKARGAAALYELPWYMIIGHPAAGKSSAILNSGLTFPFSDKHGVQGIGGTRNCDWFFSTEGVLLDTAGRYATHAEDRGEWLGFLKLLKRHRSKAPVNGILVAISFPELEQHHSETFTVYARQIRERIHEIEEAFGLRVPVYLIVTKIDLLGGFAQFFGDIDGTERDRVWGATLTHDQGTGFDIRRVVDQQLELLFRGLKQIGEDKLGLARRATAKPAHFAFPLEFHGLKEGLCRFGELLHEEDPYHAKPLIRGFYFTSALQEGEPRIAGAARIARQFELHREIPGNDRAPASHSFFLRGLFTDVLFPDQHLITRQTTPRHDRLRLAGMLAGLAALAAVSGLFTWSYVGNQKMIATVAAEREQAARMLAAPALYSRLTGLMLLQRRLETLHRYRKEGPPWQIGLALYQGDRLEAALRRQYFAGIRRAMLEPIKADIEHTLRELAEAAPDSYSTTQASASVPPSPPPQRARKHGLPIIPLHGMATASTSEVPLAPAVAAPEPATQRTKAATPARHADAHALENGYNALKTYLMLHNQARMEAAHLSDQLPRHWHPYLEENRGSHDLDDINALAAPLIAFYLSQLQASDLPLIANQDALISSARGRLRSSLTRLSAKERLYNEIKARANTRFAPLSVAAILNGKDSTIIGGSTVIPGAFTRDAWEKYVRTAIASASRGEMKGDDWVLAASIADDLGNDHDIDENRRELESLYRADYAAAWVNFLQGVAVVRPSGIPEAGQAMGRLADRAASPIKLLLRRAAYETSWDTPGGLGDTLQKAGRSMLDQTTHLLEGDAPSPSSGPARQPGLLGRRFAALALIAGSDDAPLLTGYLEQLGKLQGRLAQLGADGDRATAARQLMQATMNGEGSEFADAAQYVDTAMLGSADQATKDMLRPLLVRPLLQGYSALLPPVEEDLNQIWQREVYGQWRMLAGKYPFSDSQNEAQLADIARFLKPGDGTLDKFIDKYLSGLVIKRGRDLLPRTWGNQGLAFSPAFLAGAQRLSLAGSSLMQEGGDISRFELQPVPTPGLSEITIEIDGQVLRYRNGPQPWQTFTWPADGGGGARIQAVAFNGAATVVASEPGRMALMRLISASRLIGHDMSAGQLEWRFRGTGNADAVRFNFRMISGANPLQVSGLRGISLPARITQ